MVPILASYVPFIISALCEFIPVPSIEQEEDTVMLIWSTTESSAKTILDDKKEAERRVKLERRVNIYIYIRSVSFIAQL